MQSPLVSVIVTCYNGEEQIAETLESLLKQTYKNIEIVVVDDGSTDNTPEIVGRFRDKRLKYFYQENKGQCAASNYGLSKVRGEYMKFFDADDIMNAEHIALQVEKLNGRKDCIASCEWARFYDAVPPSAKFLPELVWKDMKPIDWLKTALSQKSDMMGAWLWLIPKEMLKTAGGWNEKLSLNNDFEFSVRLLLQAREVVFAHGAKVYYRSGNSGTLSAVKSVAAYQSAFLSTKLGCSYLLAADDSDEMKRFCANRYQEWIYRIYPHYPALYKKFEYEVLLLCGSDKAMEGGKAFLFLQELFGWKTAKLVQLFFYKLGYGKSNS